MAAQVDRKYWQTSPTKALSRYVSYAFFEGRPVTTKGRWINPLLFGWFELAKKIPELKKIEKPVFIIGTGRSGTTLLGKLLSMHRDVGFLNEPKALWHSIYDEEDIIGSYSGGAARYRLDEKDVDSEVRRVARRLFGAYLFLVGSDRVVDKYPELVFRVPFVRAIFPNAKFLFLVRNGWDTCHSILRWSERLGQKMHNEIHDWWGVNNRKWKLLLNQVVAKDALYRDIVDVVSGFVCHKDMAIIEWAVNMQEGLRQMKQHGDCIHTVRYEDLTKNPRETLSIILRFCELEPDRKFMTYAENVVTPHCSYPRMDVHAALFPLFYKTMEQLGYQP